MDLITISLTCFITIITVCNADFFKDLDKLDIDSQLKEIDRMMNAIDVNEEEALDTLMDRGAKKAADTAGDLFTDMFNTDCHYKCPDGSKPKARKSHKPSSNGCGSFGLTFELEDLPQMTKCCDKHDMCYDTCGADREECDDEFKACLDKMCKKLKKSLGKKEYQGCKDMSKLMYTGTIALGCKPYLEGQKEACICQSEENMTDRKSQDKRPDVTPEAKKEKRKTSGNGTQDRTSPNKEKEIPSKNDRKKSVKPKKPKDEL